MSIFIKGQGCAIRIDEMKAIDIRRIGGFQIPRDLLLGFRHHRPGRSLHRRIIRPVANRRWCAARHASPFVGTAFHHRWRHHAALSLMIGVYTVKHPFISHIGMVKVGNGAVHAGCVNIVSFIGSAEGL